MGFADERITEVAGYRLAEKIGSGGMGNVYKAYNASLNRFAAVKILHQVSLAERFKNEANIQSFINHPNIVHLYEYVVQANQHCIVMEYVQGEPLDELLHRKRKLSNEETENILQQVVGALVYLHRKNIIHRDIKPQNFKVQPDGTVKMLDFGIAKDKNSPKLTQVGFVVGTMEYLAPEQFEEKAELKSDIWSLGVMTYELLTGYVPFESSNPILMRAKISKGNFTDPKILIPEISDKLVTIIDKSLKINPVSRITAEGIESLLKKGNQENTGYKKWTMPPELKKMLVPGIVALMSVLLLLLFFFRNSNNNDNTTLTDPPVVEDKLQHNVLINVPGINNADLIFDDNEKHPIPFSLKGKDGDHFEFTIHAEGYKDKKVQLELTPGHSSFEFNLEKN